MRILHVADYLPDLHRTAGGAEYAARRMIEEQANAGLEIEVATLPADITPRHVPWQRHHVMGNLDRHAPGLAYAVKQLFLPWDPVAAAGLARAIRESRPDVVHYHNLHYAGLSVVHAARNARVASVWSVYDYWLFCPAFMLTTNRETLCTVGHGAHCVDCIATRRLPFLKPLKRELFRARPAAFARPAAAVDRFVVLSQASRSLLGRHGVDASRVSVIPQYIWKEAAAAQPAAPPVPGRLLYVGWVEARKGLHVVVRALARLAREHPQLHLEVLGQPANAAYQADVERFVAEQGLTDRVRFRRKVSRDELLLELQRAFLVTIPEQWENMSPVILTEAMAAGACVLASRVGGIPEFVEEGASGLLAERDSPEAWAGSLGWALAHPDEVLAMGREARRRALRIFDPGDINARTIALYGALVAAQAREGGDAR